MRKSKKILDGILSAVCASLLAFMTFLTIFQVFMRYIMGTPSTVSQDLLGFSFVWVSLLGAALVFGQGDHIKITLITDKLQGKKAIFMSIFVELLIMITAISVLIIGGMYLMEAGSVQASPTLGVTLNWIYLVVPLSGFLIVYYNFVYIITVIQDYKPEKGGVL